MVLPIHSALSVGNHSVSGNKTTPSMHSIEAVLFELRQGTMLGPLIHETDSIPVHQCGEAWTLIHKTDSTPLHHWGEAWILVHETDSTPLHHGEAWILVHETDSTPSGDKTCTVSFQNMLHKFRNMRADKNIKVVLIKY